MRPHRWLLALALAAGLTAPREAAAICDLSGPYLGTGAQLPLGCPVHVYVQMPPPVGFFPKLTVLRSGVYVDATGTITTDVADLPVSRSFLGCAGIPDMPAQTTLEPYQHQAILPKTVSVGEQIGFGTGWIIGLQIIAAAPCPAAAEPTLACTDVSPCFKEPPFGDFVEEDSGCAAGGGGGPASGLFLLGLVALRRRARGRRRR